MNKIETENLLNKLQSANHLNEILLDSIPHPALLIYKNRKVIAANKLAREAGTIVGGFCWRDWGHCFYINEEDLLYLKRHPGEYDKKICCNFCMGDTALDKNELINIKRKLGDIYWDIYWVPTREKDIYLHYAIDITEQKKIESDLRESEARCKQLTELSFEAICILSEGIILDNNKRMETMFGYERGELAEQPLSNFVMNEIMEPSEDKSRQTKYYGVKKDGGKFEIEVLMEKIFYNGNKADVLVVRDISEYKNTEEIMQKNKNTLEDAQRLAHIGYLEIDYTKNKAWWSDELYRILGYQPGEFLPDTVSHGKHIVPEYREYLKKLFWEKNPLDSSFSYECKFIKLDGREGWLRLKGDIEFDKETLKPSKIVAIMQDITEKKQVELYRSLKEAAEASNKLKNEFLATMSHELRTPLNGIIGMSQLLAKTELGKVQQSFLSTIMNCSQSLMKLMNDILDYSKIEAGTITFINSRIDIRRIAEDAANTYLLNARNKGLELDYEVRSDVPPVLLGDGERLKQVLCNLIDNAIKFTESGHVHVTVERAEERAGKMNLIFTVEDTGIGISDHEKQYLFKSFSQIDSSRSRSYGGAGLGLAICRQIVECMGGKIWVQSEKGRGSKFIFTCVTEEDKDKALTEEGFSKYKLRREFYNKNVVKSISGDTESVAAEINEKFLSLKSALDAEDFSLVESCASEIKKCALKIGNDELGKTAFKIIFAARRENASDIIKLYKTFLITRG